MDSELSELSKKVLTKDDIQVKNLETEFKKVKRYEEKQVMKDYIYNKVRDLVQDGLNQMRNYNLSESQYMIWLKYSQELLRIITVDYNPSIYLNYLKVGLNMNNSLTPAQKVGVCVDYLIGVLRVLLQKNNPFYSLRVRIL